MIRLCTDEHVAPAVVNGLRRRGVDVLTAREAGILGAPDEEHLTLAVSQERVVFSQDDDFLRMHARGLHHRGIIYARQQTPTGQLIRAIILICQLLDDDDMRDHVEFV